MFNLKKLFSPKPEDLKEAALTKDAIAELLKVSPEALAAFEASYAKGVLDNGPVTDNYFEVNAKQAAAERSREEIADEAIALNDRIVAELLAQAPIMEYDGERVILREHLPMIEDGNRAVVSEEIMAIPETIRPQLSGSLMKLDTPYGGSSPAVLYSYKRWLEEKDPKEKKWLYGFFRQGLDILDLDGLLYEMLGTNPNSMSHWLPAIAEAVHSTGFFKIPKTKIMRVPLAVLQLTRLDYNTLTPGTMDIVDRFCFRAFGLEETKDYFIKTGTYSSKYDFRNAKVTGAKEVRELGEYLLFIQNQATMMAGPLAQPCIYGVSTTNEWVVREFVHDTENNPCIYKGLPLHTEYRVFVDGDEGKVLGMNPYWDPEVMKQRFGHEPDAANPHLVHDYVIYKAHEDTLMARYHENEARIKSEIERLLPFLELPGQWSIDVMQNGDDFWVIDMALAGNSALSHCVPKGLLKHQEENWLPVLSGAETK